MSHKEGRSEDLCVSPQRPSPDVKAELFELLFRTLHHNWRYFFKSSVLASVQRGIAEEQMENEPQFSAIMQVTGKSCRGCPVTQEQLGLIQDTTWVHWVSVPWSASLAHTPVSLTWPL